VDYEFGARGGLMDNAFLIREREIDGIVIREYYNPPNYQALWEKGRKRREEIERKRRMYWKRKRDKGLLCNEVRKMLDAILENDERYDYDCCDPEGYGDGFNSGVENVFSDIRTVLYTMEEWVEWEMEEREENIKAWFERWIE